MSAGNLDVVTWFVRHRLEDDSLAEATVIKVEAVTPADAIEQVRPTLPEGHVVISVGPY